MRALLIILLFSFISNSIYSQNLTFADVEKQTYDSFIAKDYSTTLKIGKEALKQGIDFYFLRYRMGISYYENKNYEEALSHFDIAKSFDTKDPLLLEYLYYSYLYTNRNEKAASLAETFNSDMQTKINYDPKLFQSVGIELGVLLTDNLDNFKNANLRTGNNGLGLGKFYSDVNFGNLEIVNQINPKLKIRNFLSYVSNTSEDLIQSGFPNQSTRSIKDNSDYFQWNVIGSYSFNDFSINAGFGFYNANFNTNRIAFNNQIITTENTQTNFSGSASISKRFKYFEPSIGVSYTNLLNISNFISEATLTYYPLGNLNFYGSSKYSLVSNENESNSIFTQLFGIKLSKKIWFEVFGAKGNHTNLISDNGVFVYNTPNQINWYGGGNFTIFFKNFDLSLGYGFQERESNYLTGTNPNNLNTVNYTFNYNSIKTKIIWKF